MEREEERRKGSAVVTVVRRAAEGEGGGRWGEKSDVGWILVWMCVQQHAGCRVIRVWADGGGGSRGDLAHV